MFNIANSMFRTSKDRFKACIPMAFGSAMQTINSNSFKKIDFNV